MEAVAVSTELSHFAKIFSVVDSYPERCDCVICICNPHDSKGRPAQCPLLDQEYVSFSYSHLSSGLSMNGIHMRAGYHVFDLRNTMDLMMPSGYFYLSFVFCLRLGSAALSLLLSIWNQISETRHI